MKTKKEILLIAVLFFISVFTYGQARLGSYISDVTKEFPAKDYPIRDIGKNHGNGYHFYVRLDIGDVAYYSDEDSMIVTTVIVPKDEETWDYIKKRYNEQYESIDEKRWLVCFDSIEVANMIEIIDDKNDYLHNLKGDYIISTFANY